MTPCVDDVVAPHPSVRIKEGPWRLSLPSHSGSAVKGVLVSWEKELQPSPDAEALPRDSVLSPYWRKCSVRAGKAGPGSLSAACTAAGWETKSLRSFSEARATCGIHLQQACEEWEGVGGWGGGGGCTWKTASWHIRMTERITQLYMQKHPSLGFSYNKDGISPVQSTSVGKVSVMVTISHSLDNWIQWIKASDSAF